MAAKNLGTKNERPDSLALSSGVPSRTASPGTVSASPRQSLDILPPQSPTKKIEDVTDTQPVIKDAMIAQVKKDDVPAILVQGDMVGEDEGLEVNEVSKPAATAEELESKPLLSAEAEPSDRPRTSLESNGVSGRSSLEISRSEEVPLAEPQTLEGYRTLLQQLRRDYEAAELQRQEEVHDYIEKIDALHSKLQYLAKASSDAARVAGGAAPPGSVEKKLAEKEEQVALLMEEGQRLSKKELTHMTTIKKLRVKLQENNKDVADAKVAQEKAERELANITEKLRRAEGVEKRLTERQKQVTQLQKEKEVLKEERDSRDHIIASLKKQLQEADLEKKQAETQAANEALEAERKRVKDLEDDLANAKIEKNLANDRAQAQIKELREKIDKDAEKARMAELEAKNELQMLESKLEVMRTRAEEASSGVTGDAQAKLLRQIETLQSQYAIASENWQGIEASLLARAASLEKERDEATKREADIRKKAREVVGYVKTSYYVNVLICNRHSRRSVTKMN